MLFTFLVGDSLSADPDPPKQPKTGPGGKQYKHLSVTKKKYGSGGSSFWVFSPAKPAPESAPLVLFLHGWGGLKPFWYASWIHHLTRQGYLVVYPQYQASIFTLPQRFTPNARKALLNSIKKIKSDLEIKPELNRFAIVGHSAGGTIAANIGALSANTDIPVPKALMIVQPGRSSDKRGMEFVKGMFQLKDLSNIPGTTRLLVTVGEDDQVVGNRTARRIYKETTSVSKSRKEYVIVRSDRHGNPNLIADHFSPLSIELKNQQNNPAANLLKHTFLGTNSLDYYGYWKLLDGLLQGTFYGKKLEYAMGNTRKQKEMGTWSDGKPVKQLRVIPDLPDAPVSNKTGRTTKRQDNKPKEKEVW